MTDNASPPPSDALTKPAHRMNFAAHWSKRQRWIAVLAAVLLVVAGVGVVLYRHVYPSGGELVLSSATDPGANAFMPPAAAPPPTNTQAPPTLAAQRDATAVQTQPLPGNRDGFYGGSVYTADVDRDKVIDFFGAHPTQASAFIESLNTDNTVYWSGGHTLIVADIPTYLRELTPAVLRLDTRITNHGFDGAHPTTVQSVFQAGTAVLVDAHGVPRVRGLSGNPLTAPIPLRGTPKVLGTAWSGYRPGALAEVAATDVIVTFVLVDIITGQPFNRPAGTTGANDTPHTQPIAPPQPAPTAPTTGQEDQPDIDGNYLEHDITNSCGAGPEEIPYTVTHQGNTVTWGEGGQHMDRHPERRRIVHGHQ